MFHAIRSTGLPRSMLSLSCAMFLGDAICQQIEAKHALKTGRERDPTLSLTTPSDVFYSMDWGAIDWNVSRSIRMAFTGFFVSGPISQTTYLLAAKYLSNLSTAQRVFAIAAVAPCNITLTMATPHLLAGHSLSKVKEKCYRDVPPTFAMNSMYWPPALWFTISRVKLLNQGSVGSLFWLGWSVVLSMFVNRP